MNKIKLFGFASMFALALAFGGIGSASANGGYGDNDMQGLQPCCQQQNTCCQPQQQNPCCQPTCTKQPVVTDRYLIQVSKLPSCYSCMDVGQYSNTASYGGAINYGANMNMGMVNNGY